MKIVFSLSGGWKKMKEEILKPFPKLRMVVDSSY